VRFCAGCTITYPTTIAIIIYGLLTGIVYRYPWYLFFITGVFFGLFQFISLFGRGDRFRHVIKFMLGVGIGLVTIGVFRLQVHICLSIYIFYMLFMLAGLFGGRRIKKIENKCKKCSFKKDWQNCPGFKKLHDELKESSLKL